MIKLADVKWQGERYETDEEEYSAPIAYPYAYFLHEDGRFSTVSKGQGGGYYIKFRGEEIEPKNAWDNAAIDVAVHLQSAVRQLSDIEYGVKNSPKMETFNPNRRRHFR